jgi:hypothetical protein
MDKIIQCPQCGHVVSGFFDHIAIDCNSDMTADEIAALLAAEPEPTRSRCAAPLADGGCQDPACPNEEV